MATHEKASFDNLRESKKRIVTQLINLSRGKALRQEKEYDMLYLTQITIRNMGNFFNVA